MAPFTKRDKPGTIFSPRFCNSIIQPKYNTTSCGAAAAAAAGAAGSGSAGCMAIGPGAAPTGGAVGPGAAPTGGAAV
jgi:hypothetical protein